MAVIWRLARAGITIVLAWAALFGGIWGAAEANSSGAFAAVASPGRAYATCVQPTIAAAQACARQRCEELARAEAGTAPGGAGFANSDTANSDAASARCQIVAACLPAGWSGAMLATLGEFHLTNTICGAPSRKAAIEALTAFCKAHLPEMLECVIVSLWSPAGIQDDLDLVLVPGDFAATAEQK